MLYLIKIYLYNLLFITFPPLKMPYSHSQLKSFDECQLRYRYKYLDKIPESQVAESPALKF
ncbi:MAG: PD-(D/E)XK nuclease family protein [Candidatus Peribacteria bacterium]|nr:PD-(D/E)XK nuclease family protein [Candidatus Peribacteria bacterium]